MKTSQVVQSVNEFNKRDATAKKLLLNRRTTLLELADKLDCSPSQARDVISRLQSKGHNVSVAEHGAEIIKAVEPLERLVIDSKDFFNGKEHKFGALGDTHLYSKYARLDVLRTVYEIYGRDGITTVFHTGNIVDGECRFNKYDLVGPSGIDAQIEYLLNEYPQVSGITTKFITGDDHEGWWVNREGINVGELIQQKALKYGRKDLEFIGHMERDILLKAPKGEAYMRIVHPGGGSSYAVSYSAQKLVESYSGGEKPHILILGHYHKFDHSYYREVHTLQTGCVQSQTPFMRKLKLQAHVGATEVSFHQSPTGEINRFSVMWLPFYDTEFYTQKEKYKRW